MKSQILTPTDSVNAPMAIAHVFSANILYLIIRMASQDKKVLATASIAAHDFLIINLELTFNHLHHGHCLDLKTIDVFNFLAPANNK